MTVSIRQQEMETAAREERRKEGCYRALEDAARHLRAAMRAARAGDEARMNLELVHLNTTALAACDVAREAPADCL